MPLYWTEPPVLLTLAAARQHGTPHVCDGDSRPIDVVGAVLCALPALCCSPHCTAEGGLELQRVVRASDGTRKLLFKLTTGEAAGG